MSQIPLFNLSRAIEPIAEEVEQRWHSLLAASTFVGGAEVDRFERDFAGFIGAAGCVGVANGTDALILALRVMDLEPGDEVIVPSFTFIATAAAVDLVGGKPVFADVEATSLNLDWQSVEERITDRTVGILGVHLYGRPFAVDRALEICQKNDLWLIEDAAQAHGARWQGRRVGTFGALAPWSFYPAKNLGCFGDGGAVTGNDGVRLERLRRLANHGRTQHYEHAEVGLNSRLDALQAAVLNTRLPHLEQGNERRREIAGTYREALQGIGDLRFLVDPSESESVFHQETVLTRQRDPRRQFLQEKGIGTGVHYPLALHLQPAFAGSSSELLNLPVAPRASDEVVCLPMYTALTATEVETVCQAVRQFYST